MAIERRACRYDDLPAFTRFFAEHWGSGHILARDREFALWQMSTARTNVFGPDVALAGVGYWDGPDLVGFIGVMPMDFNIDGRILPGAWLCNLLADPAYRDRGIGFKLMTAVHDLPFDAVGAVGINLGVIPLYRAMRYMTGDKVPRMVRILDPEGFATIVAGDGWRSFADRPSREPDAHWPSVSAIDRLDPEWDAAFDAIARSGYFGTHRDSRFINWRYADHPRLAYRIAVARGADGAVRGLAVHRDETVRDTGLVVTRLIELLGLEDDTVGALVAHVESSARRSGAAMIDHYGTRVPAVVLARAGWIDVEELADPVPGLFQPLVRQRRDMNWAVRLLSRSGIRGDVSDRVCIVKSDGDQDRPN